VLMSDEQVMWYFNCAVCNKRHLHPSGSGPYSTGPQTFRVPLPKGI
jgi:hypothetical protein